MYYIKRILFRSEASRYSIAFKGLNDRKASFYCIENGFLKPCIFTHKIEDSYELTKTEPRNFSAKGFGVFFAVPSQAPLGFPDSEAYFQYLTVLAMSLKYEKALKPLSTYETVFNFLPNAKAVLLDQVPSEASYNELYAFLIDQLVSIVNKLDTERAPYSGTLIKKRPFNLNDNLFVATLIERADYFECTHSKIIQDFIKSSKGIIVPNFSFEGERPTHFLRCSTPFVPGIPLEVETLAKPIKYKVSNNTVYNKFLPSADLFSEYVLTNEDGRAIQEGETLAAQLIELKKHLKPIDSILIEWGFLSGSLLSFKITNGTLPVITFELPSTPTKLVIKVHTKLNSNIQPRLVSLTGLVSTNTSWTRTYANGVTTFTSVNEASALDSTLEIGWNV